MKLALGESAVPMPTALAERRKANVAWLEGNVADRFLNDLTMNLATIPGPTRKTLPKHRGRTK